MNAGQDDNFRHAHAVVSGHSSPVKRRSKKRKSVIRDEDDDDDVENAEKNDEDSLEIASYGSSDDLHEV